MSSDIDNGDIIQIEKMSADQFAGAVVLILGAVGSLLLVIWQSKCHCKVNLCGICQCERRPPNEDEMKSLKEQAKEFKNKNKNQQKKILKKEDEILEKEGQILSRVESQDSRESHEIEIQDLVPQPEPEIIIPPRS